MNLNPDDGIVTSFVNLATGMGIRINIFLRVTASAFHTRLLRSFPLDGGSPSKHGVLICQPGRD